MNNKKISTALLIAIMSFSLFGCSMNEPLPATSSETSMVTETAAPTSSPTPTPTPTPAPVKTDWSKPLFVEDRLYGLPHMLMSNVVDNRAGYNFEFKPHIISKTDREALTEEQLEHFFSYCDALWDYGSEFPCKDEAEWKLMNKMATVYNPMSDFVDKTAYTDLGGGKAKISYKIEEEDFLKKAFDFKVKLAEEVMKADLKESDPPAMRALKLIRSLSERCAYDFAEKRHYLYDAFMTGEGICSDFAKILTYTYLQCDVECTYITGGIWDREHHAITAVEQDGHYFLADLTWEADGSYYTKFWGKTKLDEGEEPGYHSGYASFKIKKAGAAGLADPQEFYNRIDFKDYAVLQNSLWSDYDPVENKLSFLSEDSLQPNNNSDPDDDFIGFIIVDLSVMKEEGKEFISKIRTVDVK